MLILILEYWFISQITYERVYKVNRVLSNLSSPLGILKVSNKVKTYSTFSNVYTDTEDDDDESEEETQIDISNNGVKYQNAFTSNENVIDEDPFKLPNNEKSVSPEVIPNSDPVLPISNTEEPLYAIDVEVNVEPGSPSTIFVDESKEIIKLVNEPVKEAKETTVAIVEPRKRYKFKKPTKFLDAAHWKKVVLTEEEAVQQFRARAENPKYQSWEFKCVDCFKAFSKEDILKRHRILRHNEVSVW